MADIPPASTSPVASGEVTRLTNQSLNAKKEDGCFGITAERKYYRVGKTFIKRSLRSREWQFSPWKGRVHVPRLGRERLINEAASMVYIRDHTQIPVPTLHCSFEDDGAIYLIMEYIEGVGMNELTPPEQEVVKKEVESHLQTLRGLHSRVAGGPGGLIIPPYRVTRKTTQDEWQLKSEIDDEVLVFCHNDLSQHNIVVDPVSLKINAIIDWEYAGFYPAYFEARFFERSGPSVLLERYGETDDVDILLRFLRSHSVEELDGEREEQATKKLLR
ncbi:MAG: hypothetical protein M1823_001340 [Watsoniomyces obsoletus]|nr:MAG: hypothetical protein M1823_001340 [Watsoniomyces obsoletus]